MRDKFGEFADHSSSAILPAAACVMRGTSHRAGSGLHRRFARSWLRESCAGSDRDFGGRRLLGPGAIRPGQAIFRAKPFSTKPSCFAHSIVTFAFLMTSPHRCKSSRR